MEIFKTPEFLILHLKRFSHQRQSFFSSRKIGELVEFPSEGLNISQYVVNTGKDNK
jgi:hypothetical protein